MAEQTYGDWIRSNPPRPTKRYKKEHMVHMTATQLLRKDVSKIGTRSRFYHDVMELIDKAEKREKEQIEKAWNDHRYNKWGNENTIINGEHYYKETYTQSGTKQD